MPKRDIISLACIGAFVFLVFLAPFQLLSMASNTFHLDTSSETSSQDSLQADSSGISLIGFPVLYRTPETGWAFGAAASIRFSLSEGDHSTPDSQIQIGGAYTQEKQILFYAPFRLYTRARNWAITGQLGYYDYSYFFFGIGDEIDPEGELYDVDFPRIRIAAIRKIASNVYAGIRYNFERVTISELDPEGQLVEGVKGSQGGVITGMGPIVEYDTRDNVYNTTRGSFIRFRYDVQASELGSDFEFKRTHFDIRHFIPYKKTVLGFQFFYEDNSSDVPFTQMSLLGGGRRLRGYYKGFYRDLGGYSLQSELRVPIIGRLGAAGFIAVGETYESRPDLLHMRWAGGLGLRFILETKKNLNLRVDYGLGEAGESGFYVTIGEAF